MAPNIGDKANPVQLGWGNAAVFTINGTVYTATNDIPGDTSLNVYLREYANLPGTKFMCQEGGCGVCLVTLQFCDPVTLQQKIVSVNSCMFPVFACHGMAVTTIEGIGNKKLGYDKTQTRLANFNGSQCGFCSPGMVMNMYSLLKANPHRTMQELEESFDGNLCRCTGYRPILDAAKSFAVDVSADISRKILDIEDILKICPKSGTRCGGKCKDGSVRGPFDCVQKEDDDDFHIDFAETSLAEPLLAVTLKGSTWYKVATLQEIFELFGMITSSYILVSGNTAKGVYKGLPTPDFSIDINSVASLKDHRFDGNNLSVGANITLADTITLFSAVAQERPRLLGYLQTLANHIKRVANVPVRNMGTVAGNLSTKHKHNDFPSDLFTIFETVGATVTIASNDGVPDQTVPLLMYLMVDMNKKVMTSINFPPYDQKTVIKTYKITPRAQNAKAYVNAGFRFKVDSTNKFKVLERPSIVYGGISKSFVHASKTENYLTNKNLMDLQTLQQALALLEAEVQPDYVLPSSTPAYRKGLTQSLLYRFILSLFPTAVAAKYKSGGQDITRPLSSGTQQFETDKSKYPINQPVLKVEALAQCSGELQYTYDIPVTNIDLYAKLVLTKVGPAVLDKVDASNALKIPGVVNFYSAKDIPGKNTFTVVHPFVPDEEELFVKTNVLYAGQPVGIIIAKTPDIANEAAKAVIITYKSKTQPKLNIEEIVKSGDQSRIILQGKIDPTATKTDVLYKIEGEMKMGGQYHFVMETLACYSVPLDDGLDVYCSSQWLQCVHEAISVALNLPENSINMKVARCGGGYGLKLTRINIPAVACSLAAYLVRQPVRMMTTIEDTMEATGKRYAIYAQYEVNVNKIGQIQSMTMNLYEDTGSSNNDPVIEGFTIPCLPNIYDYSTWKVSAYNVKTDKPSSAWTRAPGTMEGIAIAEHLMEHIANVVDLDPTTVRLNNTVPGKYPIDAMITEVKKKADYDNRLAAVEKFNSENVWKKRGIAISPMRFPLPYFGNYNVMISIYRNDATVALTHGGVEIGQGLNTKAVQTCANELGIPLSNILVKATNSLTAPNNAFTGASVTSESVCLGVIKCCEILNKRLAPVRSKLTNPTWEQVISQAYADNVDLNASAMMSPLDNVSEYNVFGVTVMECEIDVLTGEHKFIRADILEDAGQSISPLLDVGQVEGAFIMGLGCLTSEELQYDPQTGQLKTNRTWNYKVPGPKDIPIDFRVYLMNNTSNPLGVLRSKAVGEPPLVMALSALSAIRYAVDSARYSMGFPKKWIPSFDPPFTAEKIFTNAKGSRTKYLL